MLLRRMPDIVGRVAASFLGGCFAYCIFHFCGVAAHARDEPLQTINAYEVRAERFLLVDSTNETRGAFSVNTETNAAGIALSGQGSSTCQVVLAVSSGGYGTLQLGTPEGCMFYVKTFPENVPIGMTGLQRTNAEAYLYDVDGGILWKAVDRP